jgi:hypothetical protein
MGTITYTDQLQIVDCGECNIPFAIPDNLYRARRRDGKSFYCPNGHYIHWGDNENTKLKAELDQARADAAWHQGRATRARAEAEHQKRVAAGYKGALTRARRRIANGVCPCCKRSFVGVAQHMRTQHPDFLADLEAKASS